VITTKVPAPYAQPFGGDTRPFYLGKLAFAASWSRHDRHAKRVQVAKSIEERKKLSFEQAEGVEPLPTQLQLREVSPELRAALWDRVYSYLTKATRHVEFGANTINNPWSTILRDEHVYRRHQMSNDFTPAAKVLAKETRDLFERGNYIAIFGWLEFVLKHPECPSDVADDIEGILRYCRAAYRVIDKEVICPIASDTEHATIIKAFADLASTQFNGARAHLRKAASHLTAGHYADSVRESIHAVEAIGRTLDPTADVLSKALNKLEQKISIHPAMKKGFTSLYA
jgi:hypothetical protein